MSYEPQIFREWLAKLPIKVVERSTVELAWRTAWAESEKYSESLYVEMIAGRDKRISNLVAVLKAVRCVQRTPRGGWQGMLNRMVEIIDTALADEQDAGNAGGTK